jgi:hypothetical protein
VLGVGIDFSGYFLLTERAIFGRASCVLFDVPGVHNCASRLLLFLYIQNSRRELCRAERRFNHLTLTVFPINVISGSRLQLISQIQCR